MPALQDHDTVISVIDAVVAGTEMSSEVAGMRTDGAEETLGGNAFHVRAPATGNARSSSEDRCLLFQHMITIEAGQ